MGRLVDDIMAAVGVKPSDRVPIEIGRANVDNSTDSHPQTDISIQKEKEDCLGCKVVATSTVIGCIGFLGYVCWKNPRNFAGRKLFFFRGQGFLVGVALTDILYQRLTNTRLFDPEKQDFTVQDHVICDYEDLKTNYKRIFKID